MKIAFLLFWIIALSSVVYLAEKRNTFLSDVSFSQIKKRPHYVYPNHVEKFFYNEDSLVFINSFPYWAFSIPTEESIKWEKSFAAISENVYKSPISKINFPKKTIDIDSFEDHWETQEIEVKIQIFGSDAYRIYDQNASIDIIITKTMVYVYHDKRYLDAYIETDANLFKDPYGFENAKNIVYGLRENLIQERHQ